MSEGIGNGHDACVPFCVPEDVFLLWPKAGKSLEVYVLFSTVRWAASPDPIIPGPCPSAPLLNLCFHTPVLLWVPVFVPDSVTLYSVSLFLLLP